MSCPSASKEPSWSMLAKKADDAPLFKDNSQKSVSALINSALSAARSGPARSEDTHAKRRTTPRQIFIPDSFTTPAFDRANVYSHQAYPRPPRARESQLRPRCCCEQREF